ncbi:MAG: N-acetylglucosamine-6-phosphate deacetylase [Firmicutes bacterium]|nr:N-acetylglucosamine-6-phosphate deacetylase [Bacillota bacterium]
MNSLVIRHGRIVTPEGICRGDLLVSDGKIAELRPAEVASRCPAGASAGTGGDRLAAVHELDAGGAFVVPGFIDVHVHGAGGADPMCGDPASLQSMARTLASWGVTAFLATTMTAPLPDLFRALENIATARERSRQPGWGGASILGAHCEGPYFNPRRCGAQPIDHLRQPDLGEVRELYAAGHVSLRIMSLAPELPGALPVIEWLVSHGVVVGAAHSAATWDEAERAVEAGLSHATHLFNAMRPLHHREPGVAGLALTDDRIWVEVIADGQHLHPAVVRLAWRAKGPARMGIVTDLTQLAGLPPGKYTFSGQEVTLTADAATLSEAGGLAGSVTPACRVFRNLLSWGFGPVEAATLMSYNPARRMGIEDRKGSITPGKDADLVIVKESGDVVTTIVGGEPVYLAKGAKQPYSRSPG